MPGQAGGLKEQIDELDQLLDKLLKLPIDAVRSTPSVIPIRAEPGSRNSHAEDHVVLKIAKEAPEEIQHVSIPDDSHIPSLDVIHPPVSERGPKSEAVLPVEEKPAASAVVRTEDIPWLEDEPLPSSPGTGPKIEIIQGSYSQEIVPEQSSSAVSTNKPKRSLLFHLLWNITWLFDSTFGYWMPFLRRPGIKFMLGLVGVSLCVVSIYLVWINWLR